jgi:hypothetical protein
LREITRQLIQIELRVDRGYLLRYDLEALTGGLR